MWGCLAVPHWRLSLGFLNVGLAHLWRAVVSVALNILDRGGVFSQGYCLASVLWKALVPVKDSLHEVVVHWNDEGDGAKDVGVVGFEHC